VAAYLINVFTLNNEQSPTISSLAVKPWANYRKHCFLPMFRHVSKSGQTLGNISEKHRETSNVSEFARKHFCFSGNNFVSATMFPRVGKQGNI
jgi:hypothetical protein